MLKSVTAAALLAVSLSGCAAGLTGTIGQDAANAASQLDQVLPILVMEKAAALHNLQVGLDAIQAAPGMVTMTPSVSTTAPVVMTAPVTTPVPVTTAPTSTTPLPTGPTTNG